MPVKRGVIDFENITENSSSKKTAILTAKREKIEGGTSYRYRPVEGHIHRLPECR
jgi:hypothetical protein